MHFTNSLGWGVGLGGRLRGKLGRHNCVGVWGSGRQGGMDGWWGILRPRTSLKGIGLTPQAVRATSTGLLYMRMFMVMAMMSGRNKKQKGKEKRENPFFALMT